MGSKHLLILIMAQPKNLFIFVALSRPSDDILVLLKFDLEVIFTNAYIVCVPLFQKEGSCKPRVNTVLTIRTLT
jgi:hypothetical protein